jgi:hypothetical protein
MCHNTIVSELMQVLAGSRRWLTLRWLRELTTPPVRVIRYTHTTGLSDDTWCWNYTQDLLSQHWPACQAGREAVGIRPLGSGPASSSLQALCRSPKTAGSRHPATMMQPSCWPSVCRARCCGAATICTGRTRQGCGPASPRPGALTPLLGVH